MPRGSTAKVLLVERSVVTQHENTRFFVFVFVFVSSDASIYFKLAGIIFSRVALETSRVIVLCRLISSW